MEDTLTEVILGRLEEFPLTERTWDSDKLGKIRPGAPEIKKEFPLGHRFRYAEVGVFSGAHAVGLLGYFPSQNDAWFVDAWIAPTEADQPKWNWLYNLASKRIYQFPDAKIIRAASSAAAQIVPNELDFVYLDASHDYEEVLADIEAWFPKIKSGGWMWGDDWPHSGVEQAVTEFTREYALSINRGIAQWWFQKP